MLRHPLGKVSLWSSLALAAATQPAQAQWFPYGGDACGSCSTVQTQCAQPVMQTCYQTVPVTEYQPVRQTVRKAVPETRYVEQPVTEYRPVTETRVCNVPTVQYQDVTEYRQVCRNTTQYVRNIEPVCKPSPCEIDSRPGMLGWMNRTSYDFASMFTPNYRTRVTAIPQTFVENVPVTRRVAIQGTRQVSYNVTNMVATQTTRRVAINSVRYEDAEETVMRPVTVMRTVPTGTAMTFAPLGYGGSQTVYGGGASPDPIGGSRSVDRSMNRADPDKFERAREAVIPANPKTSQSAPRENVIPARASSIGALSSNEEVDVVIPVAKTTLPTAARVGHWVARTNTQPPAGRVGPTLSLADNQR